MYVIFYTKYFFIDIIIAHFLDFFSKLPVSMATLVLRLLVAQQSQVPRKRLFSVVLLTSKTYAYISPGGRSTIKYERGKWPSEFDKRRKLQHGQKCQQAAKIMYANDSSGVYTLENVVNKVFKLLSSCRNARLRSP